MANIELDVIGALLRVFREEFETKLKQLDDVSAIKLVKNKEGTYIDTHVEAMWCGYCMYGMRVINVTDNPFSMGK